jgi:hypothetical protein
MDYMEQSPCWEANGDGYLGYSLSFMEPENLLPYSREPTCGPCPALNAPSTQFPTLFP